MIGVTIGVGKWRRAAELAAEAARRHTGLETRVLGDAEWEPFRGRYDHPSYLKLHLFELIDDEDILYFDADAIHLRPWNPREFDGRPEFVAVSDPLVGSHPQAIGLEPRDYFNAGMMLLNRRHHEPMFREARRMYDEGMRFEYYWEQSFLNLARKRCGIPLLDLGQRFNHLRFHQCANGEAAETVIGHFTCQGGEPELIEAFCRDPILLNPDNAARLAGEFLDRVPAYPAGQHEGRGIVICAGGIRYLTCAWVLIKMLRHLNCTLPIEVWYLGEDEGDPNWIECNSLAV